jgi:cytoskeletal protein CcmA (bactofilin family)
MWKKEEPRSSGVAESAVATPSAPTLSASPARDSSSLPTSSHPAACISQGIRIKGEVTGNEDLFLDGQFEGKLNLTNNASVTIGPNGDVKADIFAREVIVRGRVDGKIMGREKIQLWSTSNVAGDLQTERLSIEDGAVLRGRVEIETGKPITKQPESRSAAAGTGKGGSVSISAGTAAN